MSFLLISSQNHAAFFSLIIPNRCAVINTPIQKKRQCSIFIFKAYTLGKNKKVFSLIPAAMTRTAGVSFWKPRDIALIYYRVIITIPVSIQKPRDIALRYYGKIKTVGVSFWKPRNAALFCYRERINTSVSFWKP